MNHKRILLAMMLLGWASFLVSCSEVAITGRKQLVLVPDAMMNSMSSQSYSAFLSEHTLSTDAEKTAMVKRVGTRISAAVEKYCNDNGMASAVEGFQWEFNLVEDEQVNAWAMPGGKVVVYTGLLPVTEDETGLAVVVGHEVAHVIAKHGSERMSHGLLVEFGGIALSQAMQDHPDQTQALFLTSYSIGTTVGVMLPYSRLHENEADHLGLIFMAMAGYHPEKAIGFWQRMAANSEGQGSLELLSTHPSDETRIRKLQAILPEAMAYYEDSQAQGQQDTDGE